MTTVPLGQGVYKRPYAQAPEVALFNRFFEVDPTNQVEAADLLARFGTSFFKSLGSGRVRKNFTQPGIFGSDLFTVVGETLYRTAIDGTQITISGVVAGDTTPSIDVVSGFGYAHLFIADGQQLQVYAGEAAAKGTLTITPALPPDIASGDKISIDTVYYEWTNGSVVGTPAGTIGDPYLVALGADDTESLATMIKAINATGTPDVDYSTNLQANVNVEGAASDGSTMNIAARVVGTGGNSIPITVEVGAQISWNAATLAGGGAHALSGVTVPDNVGIVSVGTLNGFVYCVVSNSDRVYFVRPGEVVIQELDFVTAESEPDELISCLRVNDEIWFFGQSSTEVWYPSGAADPPIIRSQGRAFSQGIVPGTDVRVRTTPIVVAEDGKVYMIAGGPQPISTNGIEERIRRALDAQREATYG